MKKSILIFSLLCTTSTFALSELSFDLGYDKQVYRDEQPDTKTSRTYQGSWTLYLLALTGLEFNYALSRDTMESNTNLSVTGTNYSLKAVNTNTETTVYGVGIRQGLLPKGSFIKPMVSLGYAKQMVQSKTTYIYENTTNQTKISLPDPTLKGRYDSMFGTFLLQIAVTQRISLKGSVKTIMSGTNFSEFGDNMKYLVGFSIII